MAVTQVGNVILMDADNDVWTTPLNICGIRYVAGSGSPALSIKKVDTSGAVLWTPLAAGTSEESNVEIRCSSGIHVDMAGTGTKVFLYLEVD